MRVWGAQVDTEGMRGAGVARQGLVILGSPIEGTCRFVEAKLDETRPLR